MPPSDEKVEGSECYLLSEKVEMASETLTNQFDLIQYRYGSLACKSDCVLHRCWMPWDGIIFVVKCFWYLMFNNNYRLMLYYLLLVLLLDYVHHLLLLPTAVGAT